MNVSVLCRACMKDLEVKELHHIDVRVIKMYKYCTKIVFDEISVLPKHFCSECTIKIKSTFSFIRKAQTVNETLKKFILALNHPSNIINKSLKPNETDRTTTANKNNDSKIDPRTELEQALHYLGSKYDIESAIDNADEAVDMFFKNLEESETLVGECTTDEKSEIDEINRIYNFVAPLLAEKSNEENLLEATSKLYQNMKTFAMNTRTGAESRAEKPSPKRSDTKTSDTKKPDTKRRHSKKSKRSRSEIYDYKKEKERSERSKSKKNKPSTVTKNILALNKGSSSQNLANNLANMDPNMIILKPNLSEPYDKNATDPIAVSTVTNANVNGTANADGLILDAVGNHISNNNDKIINCPMCGKNFPEDSALQEHILLDHPEDREEYAEENNAEPQFGTKTFPSKCDLCAKIFNSPAWYNKHLEREHNNRIFKCEVCNKVYISYSSWKEHKKIHAPHSNCICPVCHKHFRKSSQLTEHMVTHNDERPFPCDQCHKTFKLKAVLTKHKKVHETNRKKILCQYCGNSFLCERSLREHMVRHTGSLPFQCPECSFRCQYKTTYQRHKLRHSLYRPHECKHCRKAFYSSDDLNRHMRTHTGERPYKCPYCERSFAEHNKRKAHMVNHHQLIFEDIPRLNRDGTPYVGDNASYVEETTPHAEQTTSYQQQTSPLPGCSEIFTFTVLPDEPDEELAPEANPVAQQVLTSRVMPVQDIPMEILPPQALPHQKVTFQVLSNQEMPIQELTPQQVTLQVLQADVLPAQELPPEVSIQDMPILEIIPEAPMN